MLIPRIFHQIWVGPDPLPEEFVAYRQTWLDHHPGWRLELWTDENLPPAGELRRPEAAERLRAPWERGDIFRIEILWRMGGVHVDTDFECLRSIEPLIEQTEFFIGYRKPGRVNGALMGAVPGHPLLDLALEEMRPRDSYGMQMGAGSDNNKDESGPEFLDRLLSEHPGATFIDAELFYPRTPDQLATAYAVHHRARAWKDEEGLRRSLAKTEKRLQQSQDEVRRWKLKYEQAEEELARLRGG